MFFEGFVIFLVIIIFLILKRNTVKSESEIYDHLWDDCIDLVEGTEIEDKKIEDKKKVLEFLENEKFKKLVINTIIDLKIEYIKRPTLEINKEGMYIIAEYKSSLNNEIKTLKIVCL